GRRRVPRRAHRFPPAAESEQALDVLHLALSRRHRAQQPDQLAHRLGEAVDGLGQGADGRGQTLDHLDVVLDRVGRSMDGVDRVDDRLLGLAQGRHDLVLGHAERRPQWPDEELEHQGSMLLVAPTASYCPAWFGAGDLSARRALWRPDPPPRSSWWTRTTPS